MIHNLIIPKIYKINREFLVLLPENTGFYLISRIRGFKYKRNYKIEPWAFGLSTPNTSRGGDGPVEF